MKNRTLLMIAVIMLISIFISAAPAEEEQAIIYNNDGDFKYAVSDDTVWIVTGSSVKLLDEKLENELGAFEIAHACEHVAAYEDRLYIHYYEGEGQLVAAYDRDGVPAGTISLAPELNIVYFEAEGDRLIVMAVSGDEPEEHFSSGSIYVININDGSMTQVGEDEIYSAFAVNGDDLAAYDTYAQTLYFFSLSSGEMKRERFVDYAWYLELTDDGSLFVIGTDIAADHGKIYYADLETGKRNIAYTADCTIAGLRAGAQYLYTKEADYRTDGVYRLYAVPAALSQDEGTVLRFGCFGFIPDCENIEAALGLTEADIPGVEFEFIVYNGTDTMATAIMSGEDKCDIYFMLDWPTFNAETLYRAGATRDLREIPAVMENYGQLIDITHIMSCEDAIIAVPETLYTTAVEVNLPLFEEYGLAVPRFDWTWEEFFDLAAQVERLREEGHDIILVQDSYDSIPLHQYIATGMYNGEVDLDTERFRYIVENWKQYLNSGTIKSGFDEIYAFELSENAMLYIGEIGHVNMAQDTNNGNATIVLLPGGSGEAGAIVRRETVCMSVHAPNPEAAAIFMANCIDAEVYSDELFYENHGNLLADFEILDAVRSETKYPDHFPTTENSLLWRELLANGIYDAEYMPPEIFYEWYVAYLNDEISIDEYVFRSQERIDMVQGE